MSATLQPYSLGLIAVATMLVLTLVQQFAAAVAKNVIGKDTTPGIPMATGHDDFAFRAERAHANTLENLPPFVLLVFLAIALNVGPFWVNTLAAVFVGLRVVHMGVYYANIQAVRTLCFLAGWGTMTALSVLSLVSVLTG